MTDSPASSKPNLYALLVGISSYPFPVPRLKGPVADTSNLYDYLLRRERGNYELHVERLTNEKATRDAVAAMFKTHLAKAGEGDSVLFYFSGHGAQEVADPALWRFEHDELLEGLVCHDSIPADFANCKLLADKELRHLLRYAATRNPDGSPKQGSPHIVVVTDCCHSGDNTRGDLAASSADPEACPRLFVAKNGEPLPARRWEDFLFASEVSRQDLENLPLDDAMPQASHVALAACQSGEEAWEEFGSGVFTKHLLEILDRCRGAVTYRDLRSRIRSYIKNRRPQIPRVYASGEPSELFKNFLGGSGGSKPVSASVVWNPEGGGWLMDLGALHGISLQATSQVKVKSLDGAKEFTARVAKVDAEGSVLAFDGEPQPETGQELLAEVENYLTAPVRIFIANHDGNPDAEAQLRALLEEKGGNLSIADAEIQADYSVRLMLGRFVVTKPGDPFRPLVLPEPDFSKDSAAATARHLRHISQWEFVKNLENTAGNKLNPDAVDVEFLQVMPDGSEVPVPVADEKGKEVVAIGYTGKVVDQFGVARPTGWVKIRVSNREKFPLHIALVYLSNTFRSYTKLLPTQVALLEPAPSKPAWAQDGEAIELSYEDHVHLFNLPASENWVKVIISRRPIDVSQFELEELPSPAALVFRDRGQAKGLKVGTASAENPDAWTTRLITLRNPNPNHNKVSLKELSEWMQSEGAPFIQGVWLKPSQPFGSGKLELREGVELREGEESRGIITSMLMPVANWVYRKKRSGHYERMLKKNPGAIRIVSEGDSWFQYPHPSVLDVIDHLMNDYAVRSLDAAGDTIAHYLRSGEVFEALEKERPHFLLVSGGGNDILGEELREFLVESVLESDAPEGQLPARFLQPGFDKEMEKLRDAYRVIYERTRAEFPNVQVISHGYDYILPNPKEGWFCVNVKHKVKRLGDQKALSDHLIGTFNEMMKNLAAEYPHVHFLDNRGTVQSSLWWDEIHPNSRGFQDVAAKFKQKLAELQPQPA